MTTITVALTSGSTWLVPSDFSSTNTVYCIGAGGSVNNVNYANGAGGGACAFTSNIPLVPGAIVPIQIGTPGGTTGSGTSPTANTWFMSSALVAAGGASTLAGGAGGSVGNSAGGTTYAGGNAGTFVSGTYAPGGGGAAGPNGAGAVGGNGGSVSTVGGGQGDNGNGGAGGSSPGGIGLAGVEWTATAGGTFGSGGGGAGNSAGFTAGSGGLYGGGAGQDYGVETSIGGAGLIVVVYTSAPDTGQDIWPASTTDSPAFIAHKPNPHLMADRNYDNTGAIWYGFSQVPLTPANIFWADGDMLPQRPQYVEAASRRFNALYGASYSDTGAMAWAAYIIPATTPNIWYEHGVTDILPLQGFVEQQTRQFSLLRGQAYDDSGARWYGGFTQLAPTIKFSFGGQGGPLPQQQYVEAAAQHRALLSMQAYDDTGARWYAAITLPVTPANLFSADGSMMPQDSLGTVARLIRFGSLYNTVVFNRPPVYAGLKLIPNIFFVSGNELISDLNATINAINYDLQILNISQSYFFPLFRDMHPNGFADTLNVLVKLWNILPPPMGITPTNKIKQFLSVGAPELTLAVNTLIDEMNVFIIKLMAYT